VTSDDLATIAAELSVISEGSERYAQRVADLGASQLDGQHDDLVSAIHEAERSLRQAHRALTRAQRFAR
jgi:hypothetical protein